MKYTNMTLEELREIEIATILRRDDLKSFIAKLEKNHNKHSRANALQLETAKKSLEICRTIIENLNSKER